IFLDEVLRLEGRGEHRDYPGCTQCREGSADHRCIDCIGGGELYCATCIRDRHTQLLFHRIEHWNGTYFERKTLKTLGVRIQLGHWHGPERRCPVPKPASDDDFVIIHSNGVHEVGLDFCGCAQGGSPTVQLLRARLFPATTTNPKTAATFAVLRQFQLFSFESKCATYEFYQSLSRQTDNIQEAKQRRRNRYPEFLRLTRMWAHLQMLKRTGRGHDPAGIASTKPGECAILCPACPQPGKNLRPGWQDVSDDRKFLYALFLALDANFRLKRKDVSTEEKDPGLGHGWAFYCEVKAYMKHVEENWHRTQERSHCVAHDAVDKPDREVRGTASSGIGAVDCARHNMKRPLAVGDLQLGERYINMDYMFFMSIAGTELMRFFVSYDIACQWHINIGVRMAEYANDTISIDGKGKFMTFLVPKFHLPAHIEACNLNYSFNLTRFVGQTDGEAPERGWSDTNALARSTKESGPGFRRDTLNSHFNDWNHKKIIGLGTCYFLRRKMRNAVPEMVKTRRALADLDESLGPVAVKEWTDMATAWEASPLAKNPYETLRKDAHLAKVRRELASEAAAREAAGTAVGEVRGDMHITELVAMGLQLEEQHKLRRKIFAWIDIQVKFFPALGTVRELDDAARARAAGAKPVPGIKVWDIVLWLPSAIAAAPGLDATVVGCSNAILDHEYRLRVGQANEALHEVRRLLLVRTHLYKLKDTHARGVKANTRSADKIAALNDRVKRSASQYRVARVALVPLGRVLKRNDWAWTLQELKEDDVRGLPRAPFSDPERQKGKGKSRKRKQARKEKVKERPMSWIWINRGEAHDPADKDAMNEAVRIEWAKARARCMRWGEEVDLLEEEMGCVEEFMFWHSSWWLEQVGRKGLPEGPQLEGETAYATRQAALKAKLGKTFADDWKAIPDLVRRGRADLLEDNELGEPVGKIQQKEGQEGVWGEGSDGDEGEEEDGFSSEEEEPISLLPQREVKAAYVDEVLAYT
ncbi:hypothetical protein C8R43DRAFT_896294, partial [Mycena crocata]